jgi:general secretion pathway protein K
MMRGRPGFALMTVLWIMVAAVVVALTGTLAARDNVEAARNRIDAERAAWRANDCLERARAAVDEAVAKARGEGATLRLWRAVDRAILESPVVTADGCALRIEAAGSHLDVNAADAQQLVTLFRALNLSDAEGLADRLLDWRDADDDERPGGAEHDWYATHVRVGPRNAPFADAKEIKRVAGFEDTGVVDEVLGVEPGRICINTAPTAVLAVIPGFTPELLSRIAFERESGRQVNDVLSLSAAISRPSADSVLAHYPDIARLTTVNPEAWIIVARGGAGAPGTPEISVFAEVRLVLGEGRAVVTRRRSWQ